MNKFFKSLVFLLLFTSTSFATSTNTVVTTPSVAPGGSTDTHGSLVSGNAPVANSNNGLTDSGYPPSTFIRLAKFDFRKARLVGTTGCTFTASSTTVTCSGMGIPFDQTDIGDVVIQQYGLANGNDFHATVLSVTNGNTVVISTPAIENSSGLSQINALSPNVIGTGYSIATTPLGTSGTQTISGGTATVTATAAPDEWTVSAVRLNTGGSGGTSGTGCTFALSPASSYAISGNQATITGTVSGGALQASPTVANGMTYLALSGYTYSSGWYLNVPVVTTTTGGCAGLTGATVDIQFGILNEVITPRTGIYTSIPSNPASTTSTDSGTGLTVNFNTNPSVAKIAADNLTAMEALADYVTAQNAIFNRVCISADAGIYTTSVVPVLTHPITGPLCLVGDARIPTVFDKIPDTYGNIAGTRGALFNIVNSGVNGASVAGSTTLRWMDPTHGFNGGTFIKNVWFSGDQNSTTVQNDIEAFGDMQPCHFDTLADDHSRGALISVGASSGGSGHIQECEYHDLRLTGTGDDISRTPGIAFDSLGSLPGSANIQGNVIRIASPTGVAIRVGPCSTGNSANNIWFDDIKIEDSSINNKPSAADMMQLGESHCSLDTFDKSDGTTITPGTLVDTNEAGITGMHVNGVFTYPPAYRAAIRLEGLQAKDVSGIDIKGTISGSDSTTRGDGLGIIDEAGKANIKIDLLSNGADDQALQAVSSPNASQINAGAIDYEVEGNNGVQANIESGALPVYCSNGAGTIAISTVDNLYHCIITRVAFNTITFGCSAGTQGFNANISLVVDQCSFSGSRAFNLGLTNAQQGDIVEINRGAATGGGTLNVNNGPGGSLIKAVPTGFTLRCIFYNGGWIEQSYVASN